MSVKDLRNKFTGKVSAGMNGMKATVDNNFAQIMKIILYVGAGLVVLIVITALMIGKGCSRQDVPLPMSVRPASDPREEDFQMLMRDELVLPVNHTFEVSDDYIDFMTLKEYTPPKIDMVVKDYQTILEDAVEDELKFNFEMRGKNAKKIKSETK